MAIIKCPECNKEISDSAFSCPHCGKPFFFFKYKIKNIANYLKLVIFILLVPCIVYLSGCVLFEVDPYFEEFLYVSSLLSSGIIPAFIIRFIILKKIPDKTIRLSILTSIFSFIIVASYIGLPVPDSRELWISNTIVIITGILLTNATLLAGSGKIILPSKPQTKEKLIPKITIQTDTTCEIKTDEETKINQPAKTQFFKSSTWKDLRIPLLWIPGIAFVVNVILMACFPFLSGFSEPRETGLSIGISEIIILSLGSAIISNLAYLTAPLATRFLILKTPMKSMALSTLAATFILGMGARMLLIATGLSLGKTANVPILQEIAIYYVLTAGNTVNQFIYKKSDR